LLDDVPKLGHVLLMIFRGLRPFVVSIEAIFVIAPLIRGLGGTTGTNQ
jgi:hypothetical protein